MKNLYKIATFFVGITFFTSCEEDLIIFDDNAFIQLENATAASLVENSGGVIEIVAQLASPQTSDVTVNFDVTGDAVRYNLSPASVVILAGETEGVLSFTAIDDDIINGDTAIVVALSASSGLPVGIGGEGLNSVSKTITIVDDNVPCNAYLFTFLTDNYGSETFWDVLDADGVEVASGGTYGDVTGGDTQTASVTLDDGCYTLRVFDFYGDNGPTYTAACGALTAVNGTGGLDGIPGLDLSTVPSPGFRAGSATDDVDPYVGHAEQHDFCVN